MRAGEGGEDAAPTPAPTLSRARAGTRAARHRRIRGSVIERLNTAGSHNRGDDGDGKGSAAQFRRSTARGLAEWPELRGRWGGHRAAAGLSIKAARTSTAFASALPSTRPGCLSRKTLQRVKSSMAFVPRGTR